MAVILPTADDFRERFPEFNDVITDDDVIDRAIEDAARQVDDTWMAGDIQPAILFLAAHYLSAAGAMATFTAEDGPPIKSESIGRLSTTYGDTALSSAYGTTDYGARFETLLLRNAPRFLII